MHKCIHVYRLNSLLNLYMVRPPGVTRTYSVKKLQCNMLIGTAVVIGNLAQIVSQGFFLPMSLNSDEQRCIKEGWGKQKATKNGLSKNADC